ncbi:DEAD/DEAH box helicase [Verrucomicrobiaceae bacterium N1E253]|uniref:RNA helicase n=1 Tax=Oceaniferula marina TaxID=2748318 RepID=A0A851GM07_9BACT|nr:DEAD/DEAH box helicase [Oceaniferula marina]NWK56861.1 DEAD/DEAH box helicase [Oceaniferula marina]
MTDIAFSDLELKPELLEAIHKLGFESPSPIQAQAIPPIMEGKDIIGLSETGSGKTAAFTLPALQMIDTELNHAQVLILSPTRELCIQVCEEVHRLGSQMQGLRAVPVYGGTPIDRQMRQLKQGAHIIVGTPGRLLDHLRRKTLKPATIQLAILDEADRMLDMGFREDMEDLLGALHNDHQTLFFSATMNKHVDRLIQKFGNDPEEVSIKRQTKTVSTIAQSYYEVRNRSKVEVLTRLIDMDNPRLAIIFCNTKRSVDECTEALLARGYAADRLHGDISQQLRERTTRRFRDGKFELLVATDVAARGLDIDDVDAVFNYDIPQDPEDYVHRIGRTGRAGREGKAVSFVFGRDIYRLQSIEKYTKQHIQREKIPSQEEVEGRRADQLFSMVQGRLEQEVSRSYRHYIDRLLDQGHTATDIASSLFELLREAIGREGEEIVEDRPDYNPNKDRGARRSREKGRGKENRRERGDRGDRRDGKRGKEPHMSTLFLSLGKAAGVRPSDILGMFYREGKIPDNTVGQIQLFDRHALVDVHQDHADALCKNLSKSKLRNQRFRIGPDRMA